MPGAPLLRPMRVAALACAGLAMSACSFTDVEPTARGVEVLAAERVTDCRRLGETRVSVADRIGFIPRHANAVQEDLHNLARNSAADMGGDTVTAIGEPADGRQTYGVYDCIDA